MLSQAKKDLLIYGYFHEHERKYCLKGGIPAVIYKLVLVFSPNAEFRYMGGNEDSFDISNGGATVSLKNGKFGTVMYGDFLTVKQKSICTVHIELHADCGRFHGGFGLCTRDFTEFRSQYYNAGKNHSLTLNKCGYFKTSEEFVVSKLHKHSTELNHMKQWCRPQDTIAIHVDMLQKTAWIWNYSKSTSYENNEQVLLIGLPNEVAVVIYGGQLPQTYTVTHHELH